MIFAFDLDGTVTLDETLPLLSRELGLEDEMKRLTDATLRGEIDFKESFRMRYEMLRAIPIGRIQEIMKNVRLDEDIASFIKSNKDRCFIVTGNLDKWIEPIRDALGCRAYTSESAKDLNGGLRLSSVLDKGDAIRSIKNETNDKVVAIGESFNDIPMFEASDLSIAYGGVHPPVEEASRLADYIASSGKELCDLLTFLSGQNK
ncbi:MAG: HAD family phosphatase [Schwartzia sp.]|nr:HAD family phosphatase [Schwartzia sp. (in: firmicutes)]